MISGTGVFIIGGGPAGLAAGIAARQAGLQVALADCACPPIDKACGEGLMPDALAALGKLGISIGSELGFPFRGIRFIGDGVSVEADFPSGMGLGVRRPVLHRLLLNQALQSGVSLLWGIRSIEMNPENVKLDGRRVATDFIVGADGQNSRVRRDARLDSPSAKLRRFGFRRHYRISPWTDYVEIYWGDGFQIYVTPVAREEVCVALISRSSRLRLDEAIERFPEVKARLRSCCPSSAEMGSLSISRKLKAVQRRRIALAGDASGSVDAITGQGLSLSFQQALALADAMRRGDLGWYQARHRECARRPNLMASLMLAMDRQPAFRRRLLRGFERQPRLFSRLLAFHVGSSSLLDFRIGDVIQIGRELLTA